MVQEYQSELTQLENMKKEKEETEKVYNKHDKLINRLEDENQKIEEKIIYIENENKKIKKKIKNYQETQEQLIMLVKIIQKSGIDVEKLIDEWNNEIENDTNNNIESEKDDNNINNDDESLTDSNNELNKKIDPSSFIPINIEKPQINKKVLIRVPKLNLDIIKNNDENNKKGK
jgi:chromosome segregation ATPase